LAGGGLGKKRPAGVADTQRRSVDADALKVVAKTRFTFDVAEPQGIRSCDR
jgi:hypothetical protein